MPQNTELPSKAANRPSSSMKEMTLTPMFVFVPASTRARAISKPKMTPMAPSNQPPSGTVSVCEAMMM